jgi:hypothetical protein
MVILKNDERIVGFRSKTRSVQTRRRQTGRVAFWKDLHFVLKGNDRQVRAA